MLSSISLSYAPQVRQNTLRKAASPSFKSNGIQPETFEEKEAMLASAYKDEEAEKFHEAEQKYRMVFNRKNEGSINEFCGQEKGKNRFDAFIKAGTGLARVLGKQGFDRKMNVIDMDKAADAVITLDDLSYYCGVIAEKDLSVAAEARLRKKQYHTEYEALNRKYYFGLVAKM